MVRRENEHFRFNLCVFCQETFISWLSHPMLCPQHRDSSSAPADGDTADVSVRPDCSQLAAGQGHVLPPPHVAGPPQRLLGMI